jgi:carboxyl-terminal processing protease
MSRRNLLVLLAAIAVSSACYLRGEQNPYSRYTADGLTTIKNSSLDSVTGRELFEGAMHGMVEVLHKRGDAHSQYLNEAEADPLRSEIHQQFGGIGVRIGRIGKPPRLAVVAPPDPGSPAARAKLQAGDYIIAIDDAATAEMDWNEVLRLMRGDPGTTVRLSIERPSEQRTRTVELIRQVIQIESVLGDRRNADGSWQFRLPDDARVAHIRIRSFGDRTAAEFANVLERSTSDGARAVVLDLRENPGGSLDAAVAVCQMLLPAEKTIVETRGRGQALLRRYATVRDGLYLDLPIAVVVNQNSASAAEIVAACLQDHGRAAVVGQRTFGKGTVQQLLPLESGKSLLKLTWASFWRPSGANIHHATGVADDAKWGVMPDAGFERKLTPEEHKIYEAYREKRDGYRELDATSDVDHEVEKKVAGFIDEPLKLAVGYLQRKLASKL